MSNREKVIKDLEAYRDRDFIREGITVFDSDPRYRKMIINNALALLKEKEAKHGKWLESKILEDCFWVCSECEFPSEAFTAPMIYKYCPNCGVKMDRR